jgi:hypothetical protein
VYNRLRIYKDAGILFGHMTCFASAEYICILGETSLRTEQFVLKLSIPITKSEVVEFPPIAD